MAGTGGNDFLGNFRILGYCPYEDSYTRLWVGVPGFSFLFEDGTRCGEEE